MAQKCAKEPKCARGAQNIGTGIPKRANGAQKFERRIQNIGTELRMCESGTQNEERGIISFEILRVAIAANENLRCFGAAVGETTPNAKKFHLESKFDNKNALFGILAGKPFF